MNDETKRALRLAMPAVMQLSSNKAWGVYQTKRGQIKYIMDAPRSTLSLFPYLEIPKKNGLLRLLVWAWSSDKDRRDRGYLCGQLPGLDGHFLVGSTPRQGLCKGSIRNYENIEFIEEPETIPWTIEDFWGATIREKGYMSSIEIRGIDLDKHKVSVGGMWSPIENVLRHYTQVDGSPLTKPAKND